MQPLVPNSEDQSSLGLVHKWAEDSFFLTPLHNFQTSYLFNLFAYLAILSATILPAGKIEAMFTNGRRDN